MEKPVRRVLSICLLVCCYVLMQAPASSAEVQGGRDLDRSVIKYGGIYRRTLAHDPARLDPAFVTDIYSRAVVRQVFDGLVQYDAHLKPIPALAEYWEASRDGLTWTFTLRRGVKFHHGREVTADDFVYSFTRLLDAKKPGPLTDLLSRMKGSSEFMQGRAPSVEGLRATDRYTLRLVLQEPLASSILLLSLGDAAVVPRETVEELGERFGQAPVGTGAFKFVHWEPDREVVLQANTQYYQGRPFLDGLIY